MTDLHNSDLTTKLHEKIKQLGERSFFNGPASIKDIEKLEKITKLTLPDNLKQFYLNFNGGFFAEPDWTTDDLKDKEIFPTIRWNSNYILSVGDIIKSYKFEEGSLSSCDIQEQEEDTGKRFLPFLHTRGQEMLVLDATNFSRKTPILDAFHEVNADEWGVIFPSFEDFLISYIEKEGDIETISSGDNSETTTFDKPKKGLLARLKDWFQKKQIDTYLDSIEDENKRKK